MCMKSFNHHYRPRDRKDESADLIGGETEADVNDFSKVK